MKPEVKEVMDRYVQGLMIIGSNPDIRMFMLLMFILGAVSMAVGFILGKGK